MPVVGCLLCLLIYEVRLYVCCLLCHATFRLRLQEGFHFAQTNSGVVSMILEVDMTVSAPHAVKSHARKDAVNVQYL